MKTDRELHFTGIIPARYSSVRFPGKPLASIGGKTVIQLVYEKAEPALSSVYVATDDERIFSEVTRFGGKAIMTSASHRSGTDRCAEAVSIIEKETGRKTDVIINIQGDEPFIRPEQVRLLASCFNDKDVEIATLIRKVNPGEDLLNVNQPKVVISKSGDALYFSRSAIPYLRDEKTGSWLTAHTYFKHLGIYGYLRETLSEITRLPQSSLELAESLEQNRWLENGYRIRTAVTEWESIGIDTPEDLERAREFFNSHGPSV
jgi:3-deoxy-manno-octulosonate cytidylyltransferase (CMP-KDO synthetase)